MDDNEAQQGEQPPSQAEPITHVDPPGFHPDESLIDSSKRHEPWESVETRRLTGEGEPPIQHEHDSQDRSG